MYISRYEIMRKSWDQKQENRPSFQDIHKQLKEMLAETDQVRESLICQCYHC